MNKFDLILFGVSKIKKNKNKKNKDVSNYKQHMFRYLVGNVEHTGGGNNPNLFDLGTVQMKASLLK